MWRWATPHAHAAGEHTHGAAHTQSHNAAMGMARGHRFVTTTPSPPSLALARQAWPPLPEEKAPSVAMPGMFWQETFPESCTFEEALKKPRPLCLNSD